MGPGHWADTLLDKNSDWERISVSKLPPDIALILHYNMKLLYPVQWQTKNVWGTGKKKKVKGTSCMHWSISCCKGCHFNIEWISSLLLVKEYILFPFLCICYSLVVSYCLTQCNIWSVSLFQNIVFDLFACQRHIHHYWFTLGIHVIFWV